MSNKMVRIVASIVLPVDVLLGLVVPLLLWWAPRFGASPATLNLLGWLVPVVFWTLIGVQGGALLFLPKVRRFGVVIVILVAAQLGFFLAGAAGHPQVVEPQQPFENFPMSINLPGSGLWEGSPEDLDQLMWNQSEADQHMSRKYSKERRSMYLLLAEYKSPGKGIYHNPLNCYHTHGFTQVGGTEWREVKAANRPVINVSVTTWMGSNQKVIVAYWYEVGDNILYERGWDQLKTHWAMRGKAKWPVMFKVLLTMPANEGEQSKDDLLELAQKVREWLGDDKVKPPCD